MPDFRPWLSERLEQLQLHLARPDAIGPLVVLGLLSGLIAGAVMVIFRLLIAHPKMTLLGLDDPEQHEQLSLLLRFLAPTLGGLLLGLWFQRLLPRTRRVGVVHVLDALTQRDGWLPIRNALVQFWAAIVCIVAGHSIGREGPSIHIGAACGSWMGQQLSLPGNSLRVLVACGAAGAIAAAFNTPLAGVVFALEVLLLEYTLAGFIPIIVAAVGATVVTRLAFGPEPVFAIPEIPRESLGELLYIIPLGMLLGLLACLFTRLLVGATGLLSDRPIWQRLTLAGVLTGVIALPVPEIMGIGYDTVNAALLGELSLGLLLVIVAAKLLATTLGLGLGLPGGLIGPTLVIGATAGGALGLLLERYAPGSVSANFYAMLGMSAMMAAVLNAPLAALTALLELTGNPYIILPGMLAVITASLTCQHLLRTPSVFHRLLRAQGGRLPDADPISQLLRRIGVGAAMDRRVQSLPQQIDSDRLGALLEHPPAWLLLPEARPRPLLIFAVDLQRVLDTGSTETTLDLAELPVQHLPCAAISVRASLLRALRRMDRLEVDALYVVSSRQRRLLGVLTRQQIEASYRRPRIAVG